MREPETYRMQLEDINQHFGGKSMLSLKEVSSYTGKCENWCRKYLGMDKNGITNVKLALSMSKL